MNNPGLAMEDSPDSMTCEMRRDTKAGIANQVVDGFSNAAEMTAWATCTDSSFEGFVRYFGEFLSWFVLR
jgi:hypothetical protein